MYRNLDTSIHASCPFTFILPAPAPAPALGRSLELESLIPQTLEDMESDAELQVGLDHSCKPHMLQKMPFPSCTLPHPSTASTVALFHQNISMSTRECVFHHCNTLF